MQLRLRKILGAGSDTRGIVESLYIIKLRPFIPLMHILRRRSPPFREQIRPEIIDFTTWNSTHKIEGALHSLVSNSSLPVNGTEWSLAGGYRSGTIDAYVRLAGSL